MLWVWVANIVLLALVLLAALLSDGNGRLPGLSEKPSVIVVGCLVGIGVSTDILVGWCDRKRRIVAVAVGVAYILLLVPVLV